MTSQAIEATPQFVDLVLSDWEGGRKAHLEGVPRSATVGEVVAEAVRALGLPIQSFYHALFRGRELPHSETLDEAGLEGESELELSPQVSAGAAG
jgi:hypothetical protein